MTEEQIRQIVREELQEFLASDRYIFNKLVQMMDGRNVQVGRTTGTKIGTAAAQKLGFFGATPVIQQTKAGHNNWAATSDVVSALVSLGLFDQS